MGDYSNGHGEIQLIARSLILIRVVLRAHHQPVDSVNYFVIYPRKCDLNF